MAKKKKTSKRCSTKDGEEGSQRNDDGDIGTVLCGLCRGSRWTEVYDLLKDNPRVALEILKMDNNNSTTILHQVITTRSSDMKSRSDIIDYIVRHTPEAARIKNGFGSLPLHVVTQRNIKLDAVTKEHVILSLVDAYPGALFVEGGVGKRSPLHIVFTDYTSSAIVKRMLDVGRGAALVKDKRGWLPIHVAASRHCSPHKIEMLLDACPRSLFATTEDTNETPLQLAMSTATKTHPNHTLIKYLKAAEAKYRAEGVEDTCSSNDRLRINDVQPQPTTARGKRRLPTSLDHSIGRGGTKRRRRSKKKAPQEDEPLDEESTSVRYPSPSFGTTRTRTSSTTTEEDENVEEEPQDWNYSSTPPSLPEPKITPSDNDENESEVQSARCTEISEEERQQALTLLLFRQAGDDGARREKDEGERPDLELHRSNFHDPKAAKSHTDALEDDACSTSTSESSIDDMPPLSSGMILPTSTKGVAHRVFPSLSDEVVDSKPKAISFSEDFTTDLVAPSIPIDGQKMPHIPREASAMKLYLEGQRISKNGPTSPFSPNRTQQSENQAERRNLNSSSKIQDDTRVNPPILEPKTPDEVAIDRSPRLRKPSDSTQLSRPQEQPHLSSKGYSTQETTEDRCCQQDATYCNEEVVKISSKRFHGTKKEKNVQVRPRSCSTVESPNTPQDDLRAAPMREDANVTQDFEVSTEQEVLGPAKAPISSPERLTPLYTQHKLLPTQMKTLKPESTLAPRASEAFPIQLHSPRQGVTHPLSRLESQEEGESSNTRRGSTKPSPSVVRTTSEEKIDHVMIEQDQHPVAQSTQSLSPGLSGKASVKDNKQLAAGSKHSSIRGENMTSTNSRAKGDASDRTCQKNATESRGSEGAPRPRSANENAKVLYSPKSESKPIPRKQRNIEGTSKCVPQDDEQKASKFVQRKSSARPEPLGEGEGFLNVKPIGPKLMIDEVSDTLTGNMFELPTHPNIMQTDDGINRPQSKSCRKEGSIETMPCKQKLTRSALSSNVGVGTTFTSKGKDHHGERNLELDDHRILVDRSDFKDDKMNTVASRPRISTAFAVSNHNISAASPLRSRRLRSEESDKVTPRSDNRNLSQGNSSATSLRSNSDATPRRPLDLNLDAALVPTRGSSLSSGRGRSSRSTFRGRALSSHVKGTQMRHNVPSFQSDAVREQIIRDRLLMARIRAQNVPPEQLLQESSRFEIPSISKPHGSSLSRQDQEALAIAEEITRRRMLGLQHERESGDTRIPNLYQHDRHLLDRKRAGKYHFHHGGLISEDERPEIGTFSNLLVAERGSRRIYQPRPTLETSSSASTEERQKSSNSNLRIQRPKSTNIFGKTGDGSVRQQNQTRSFVSNRDMLSSPSIAAHPRSNTTTQEYRVTGNPEMRRMAALAKTQEMQRHSSSFLPGSQRSRFHCSSFSDSSHYSTYPDGLVHAPHAQSVIYNTVPTAHQPTSRSKSGRRTSRAPEKVQWFQPYMGGV